jgi:guanyl-specific ribonuclease Sa
MNNPKHFITASATTHSLSYGGGRGNVLRRERWLLWFSLGLGLLLAAGPAFSQSTSSGFTSGYSSGLNGGGLDLQKAQSAARNGLSDQEMDSACEAAVAKHMTSADVDALSRTLGMSPAQASQLTDCISRGGPTPSASENGNAAVQYPTQATPRVLESSRLESRFHELDNPYKMLAAPKAASLEQFG